VDTQDELQERASVVLDEACVNGWRVPNKNVYPHQWLWDSCFHAITLASLNKHEEAVLELELMFSAQSPEGFVPHMVYHNDPQAALELWRQQGHSNITQPPMYGHALRIIKETLPTNSGLQERVEKLIKKAADGLEWLLRYRRWFEPSPLAIICHPWETGCDDSLRWDGWMHNGTYNRSEWGERKKHWVQHKLQFSDHAGWGATSNPDFGVADAGFNALLAFNAAELAHAGASDRFRLTAVEIGAALNKLYNEQTGVFDSVAVLPDADPYAQQNGGVFDGNRWWRTGHRTGQRTHSVVRPTLDATLPALVINNTTIVDAVVKSLINPERFGARFGPRGAHANTPGYLPVTYWRGPTWPQLSYLCWVMATRAKNHDVADRIAIGTAEAVLLNNFSEFWHPDTGEGGGPAPQTWSTVACAMNNP
jgi:hypothetical protein